MFKCWRGSGGSGGGGGGVGADDELKVCLYHYRFVDIFV